MNARLLVTSAGSGASSNLVRSLRAGNGSLTIVGCHDDQFILKNSTADRNYLVPPLSHPTWARALRRVVDAEKIDLVIPTSDGDVAALSRVRGRLPGRLFLPRAATVERCGDKYELTEWLRARGVPAPRTYRVTDLRHLERIFERLGNPSRAWCRIREGAGSRGAAPVAGPDQTRSWIRYWRDMRDVPVTGVHPVRVPARSRFRLPERLEGWPRGPREDVRTPVLSRQRESTERGVGGRRAHQDGLRAGRGRDHSPGASGRWIGRRRACSRST